MDWLKRIFGKGGNGQDDFAAAIAVKIKEKYGVEVGYDRERFVIYLESTEGTQVQLNLHNAYDEFLNVNVNERENVLARYAQMLFAMDEPIEKFEDQKVAILPRVQERSFYESMKLQILIERKELPEPSQIDWPYLSLAEHLAIGLVVDTPDSIRMINTALLNEWGTNFDESLEIALQNLRMVSSTPMECIQEGLYISPWRDNHDAARLLLLGKIREECLVRGDYLAFVPNRDHLIVTGTNETESLSDALDLVQRLANEPRPMRFVPLILQGDSWELYDPQVGQHEYDRIRDLRIEAQLGIYGENKTLLDGLYEKMGNDIFIANYAAVRNDTGDTVMTYCVWSEDVDTLLPRTEKVIFVREVEGPDKAEPVGAADFDQVLSVMGDMITRIPDMYPERYKVFGFPNQEQMRRMKVTPL